MKKRILVFMLSIMMTVSSASAISLRGGYYEPHGKQTIYPLITVLDGRDVDPEFYIQGEFDRNGSYLYLTDIVNELKNVEYKNWSVTYDKKSKVATVDRPIATIKYTIGSSRVSYFDKLTNETIIYSYDKDRCGSDMFPIINEGKVMIPFKYLDSLGFDVGYSTSEFKIYMVNTYSTEYAVGYNKLDMQNILNEGEPDLMQNYLYFDPYVDFLGYPTDYMDWNFTPPINSHSELLSDIYPDVKYDDSTWNLPTDNDNTFNGDNVWDQMMNQSQLDQSGGEG